MPGVERQDHRPLVVFVHGSAEMYGSDKVLLNLARAAQTQGLHQPLVLLHEDGPLRQALAGAGVEVHIGPVAKISRAMFGPAAPWRLLRSLQAAGACLDAIVAGRRVALVYSNTLAVLGGAFWARRRQMRHLWHVHEIILKPGFVANGLPWLADRLSHAVICNSQQTAHWLLAQAPSLRPRCHVIFNGMPDFPASQMAAVRAARERMGAGVSDVLVTLAGRLNHWKGQGLLIDALRHLRDQGRLGALRAAIVGDVFADQQVVRDRLLQQVEQAGLQDCVKFLPFQTDIQSIWLASDMAVVPSLEPEPFGMVAIEAMACGLPVVAAAHGGLLDIVEDEVTGLLFEPKSAEGLALSLERLTLNAELRSDMGQVGRLRQRALFSMQGQADATQAVCEQVGQA
jgi:glycosyltransferase involved in cell wall biosynthesis